MLPLRQQNINLNIVRLTPAQYVIGVFGSVHKTAKALKIRAPSVSKWYSPRRADDLNGFIPLRSCIKILRLAGERDLDITPNDLFYGRKIDE